MSHATVAFRVPLLLACLALSASARQPIIPSPAHNAWELHGEAGLTLATGVENVLDQMETNFGVDRDVVWPIGIRLGAYVKNTAGLAFGGSLGPCEFIRVRDRNHRRYRDDHDQWSYIIPMSVDVRYFLPEQAGITPYARVGISQPISGGDHIGSGTPGPVGAIGAQVWQHHIVSLGIEAGYDASQVKVKSGDFHRAEKVRPVEFTFSVFAVF